MKFIAVPIRTSGDRITTAAKLRQAGKGVFVKELERALLKRQIDLAVHSMKDLPSQLPDGLAIGAVPERADPSDVYIGRTAVPIDKLRPGSTVGTSSLRRQAILKSLLPHLQYADLRGNLDTRLEKLKSSRSNLSGIVVAAAGLQRLYPQNGFPTQVLPRDKVVPAPAQGALAIEIREANATARELIAPLNHPETEACTRAERELMRRLEGGCQIPLGALAEQLEEGLITLTACLCSLDGSRRVRETLTGDAEDPLGVAEALETILNSHGAREILDELRPRTATPRKKSAKKKPKKKSKKKSKKKTRKKPRPKSKRKPKKKAKKKSRPKAKKKTKKKSRSKKKKK